MNHVSGITAILIPGFEQVTQVVEDTPWDTCEHLETSRSALVTQQVTQPLRGPGALARPGQVLHGPLRGPGAAAAGGASGRKQLWVERLPTENRSWP